MDTVFLEIVKRLEAIPELRYVSEDWGQLNFEQPPVNFPCALVDLGEIRYTQAGRNTQQAEATLNVTIADIRFDGITMALPKDKQGKAFEVFRIIESVNRQLHGYESEKHSRLVRQGIKKIIREDAVREFLITYRFGFTDESAMPVYTNHPTPPDIKLKR